MKTRLAYGTTGLEINLPDHANVTVVESVHVDGLTDQAGSVRNALRQPLGSLPVRALAKSSDRVGVIFSDITRPTPNHLILPTLLSELDHVPDEQIVLFNSTGTHRFNKEVELRGMLGDEIVDRYRIVQNDANDRDSHVLVGTATSGNSVWIHKEFVKCDVRIATGCVEPHFFAGLSGGPKAIMPGLALLETVMQNHSTNNVDSPLARWGITGGNPVWEEINEAAAMVEPSFLLNVALNHDKQITGVFAGDFQKAHAQACTFVRERTMLPVQEPFDIVIASNSGYPLDLNLYQSVKGMSAASQVVKERGSIIIAADCWDGIPNHGEYGQLLLEAQSPKTLLETIRAPGLQRQDMWQAQIHALICLKAWVYFYSHNLSDEQILGALLKPCRDIEATVAELLRFYGPEASVCVLPDGPRTIPFIRVD